MNAPVKEGLFVGEETMAREIELLRDVAIKLKKFGFKFRLACPLKPWLLTGGQHGLWSRRPQNLEEGWGQGCYRVASTDPDASWM